MTLRRKLKAIEDDTQYSFDEVKKDVQFLYELYKETKAKNEALESALGRALRYVKREFNQQHKHGRLSGTIYPTLTGKVAALAEHLGVTFDVKPQEVTPAKTVVSKKTTKKAKK